MPLKKSGKNCVSYNVGEMRRAGHPRAQSIAAAYASCGERKKSKRRKSR